MPFTHSDGKLFSVQGSLDKGLLVGKPMWSVDTVRGYPHGNPSLTTDTKVDSCMRTSIQPYAWWAIDLGQDYELEQINILGWSEKNGG